MFLRHKPTNFEYITYINSSIHAYNIFIPNNY